MILIVRNISRLDKLPISIIMSFPSSSYNIKNSSGSLSAPTVPTIDYSFITLSLQPPYGLFDTIVSGISYFGQNFGPAVGLLSIIGGAIYGIWKLILRKSKNKDENREETDSKNAAKT